MKKPLSKFGFILLSFLPFLAAEVIQYAAAFFMMLLKALSLLLDPSGFNINVYYSLISDIDFNAMIMVLYGITAAVLFGIWYFLSAVPSRLPRRKLKNMLHPGMIVGIFLIAISLQYVSSYLIMAIAAIRPSLYDAYETLMQDAGMYEITLTLLLYSVLVAPICEELIFRGVTLHYARKALPFWAANIFQAVLFGIFHMNFVQGAYAFIVGLFCGFILHAGKSIYFSIVFHILFNIAGTIGGLPFYSGDSIILQLVQLTLPPIILLGGALFYKLGSISCRKRLL